MPTKAGYVALVGRPNAGKSTLMNSILGTKLSIVTPKPQTTRKRVLGIYTGDDLQIVFLDTPGILTPRYELQRSMMGYVNESIADADIVTVIIDVDEYKKGKEIFPVGFLDAVKESGKPHLLVLNKIDLLDDVKEVLPLIQEFSETNLFNSIIPLSALKSGNLNELMQEFRKRLPPSPFFYDPEVLSTHPERFFVSEIIREHVFIAYKQEIPYSTEVYISDFKEREKGKWYILADIIVERPTQKAIIIGAKGSKIKKVGEKARADIEKHLQMPVYLELFVKVRDKWRDNKQMLKSLGY